MAGGDFNYVTLTGVNRYWAFDYLKKGHTGSILNPTAKEAVKIGHWTITLGRGAGWASDETIEQYIQADPNLTQKEYRHRAGGWIRTK